MKKKSVNPKPQDELNPKPTPTEEVPDLETVCVSEDCRPDDVCSSDTLRAALEEACRNQQLKSFPDDCMLLGVFMIRL